MITAIVHSIRASLLSNHRVVLLKDVNAERYLPIWIGPFEAEAIALALQHIEPPRPMTHDLLKMVIVELGGTVSYILINALVDNTFHGRIVVKIGGRQTEVDSRPSDAIALAVRCNAPIYVSEEVMAQASIVPSPEVELPASVEPVTPEEEEHLSVFREFLEGLDSEEEQKDE